jgi:RHS repeat-associated protein
MLTLKAHLTGGAYQTTEWVYGATTATGSDINCNECLVAMKYPDKSSGDPSNTEKEVYTTNGLCERKGFTDRNGNVHTYTFDVVGRPSADAITTLGSGVDGAIRRLETAYDTGGRAYLFTSYDASSGGNVVNQVQRGYNGLSQLTVEYQAHAGAVVIATTPKVQYAYSEMSGGANHSRQVSMTYPSGRTITYNYASVLANTISRLSSITYGSTTLESLDFLGLGTLVKRAHPQPGVDLTYIKQSGESNGDAGDQYTGLDRFGRIVDQRWIKTSDGSHTDRFKYGYDRNSNRLYEDNIVNSLFSELYHANGASAGYDSLNQLTDFRRGTLSDSNSDNIPDTVTTASRTQSWAFDPLGNWSTLTTDGTGQTRTHNKQNQITSIQSLTTPTYDANGNTTKDETAKQYVYDAWNRLVQVKDSGGTPLISYSHDALRRRITEGSSRVLYYSAEWQVLEERDSGVVKVQQVWSPVYIDAMIERDRDADGNSGNGLEERLYVQQDANFNVSSILNTSGSVQERYIYDPYGSPTILAPDWTTRGSSQFAWGYLHQGGRRDGTSGLYSYRHRDLMPVLGRWTRPDPLVQASDHENLFLFVKNSPVGYKDPSGLLIGFTRQPPRVTFGPGTLVVQACHDKWRDDAFVAAAIRCGYTLGVCSGTTRRDKHGRPVFWRDPPRYCADNLAELADMICDAAGSSGPLGQPFDKLVITGHCFSPPVMGPSCRLRAYPKTDLVTSWEGWIIQCS